MKNMKNKKQYAIYFEDLGELDGGIYNSVEELEERVNESSQDLDDITIFELTLTKLTVQRTYKIS